ncbi:hypothetical protein ACFL2Q_20225, partial [Thermodesulfobacteriota bacterium]
MVGIFSFFSHSETPEEAIEKFVKLFEARDAAGITKIIHPDIVSGKEIGSHDVENFLVRYSDKAKKFLRYSVDKRLTSEDGKTKRIQATLLFEGPRFKPYSKDAPSQLEMTLMWVQDKDHWWVERPLSIGYLVKTTASYPTGSQQEIALRFQTTLQILDRLGLPGDEDIEVAGVPVSGTGMPLYKEMEKLYAKERGKGGVDANARGVTLFLKG